MQTEPAIAPPLRIQQWFNAPAAITLEALRGRVVMLHAFQMLCPACVSHGLPQAVKARALFAQADVAVIGLHTVFEHHTVMNPVALEVFIHEYRLSIPIGVDQPGMGAGIPLTMQAYGLRGTPSVVLLDRRGRVRLNHFGVIDDMALGAAISQLVAEPANIGTSPRRSDSPLPDDTAPGCDNTGCRLS